MVQALFLFEKNVFFSFLLKHVVRDIMEAHSSLLESKSEGFALLRTFWDPYLFKFWNKKMT